jgi:hypothetical protein
VRCIQPLCHLSERKKLKWSRPYLAAAPQRHKALP